MDHGYSATGIYLPVHIKKPMADISINNLCKSYDGARVLSDISLHVSAGEFIAVLGPSGCGKTTLLRLIAGFETPDQGCIALNGTTVSSETVHLPPEKRNVGIVFQNYALWPHMSVAENIGYSLKISGIPKVERQQRVMTALQAVNMPDLGHRRSADLSGGQRQRVALGRCLAASNPIILLDEPLANLDVHLRSSMEREFLRFHRHARPTMLYITHDQSEAMAMADRIAVMDHGRIVQFASPATLYREPATEMVASFIGQGFTLDIENVVSGQDGFASATLFGQQLRLRCVPGTTQLRSQAKAGFHSDGFHVLPDSQTGIAAHVTHTMYRGGFVQAEVSPVACPDIRFSLAIPEITPVAEGDLIHLGISDGWVIPKYSA